MPTASDLPSDLEGLTTEEYTELHKLATGINANLEVVTNLDLQVRQITQTLKDQASMLDSHAALGTSA